MSCVENHVNYHDLELGVLFVRRKIFDLPKARNVHPGYLCKLYLREKGD